MVTLIFKSLRKEDSEMFWKLVCSFEIRFFYA